MDKSTLDDCGKFAIGSTVWFLVFEQPNQITVGDDYEIFSVEHPIFLFSRTPIKCMWQTSRALPKLEGDTFDTVMSMITCKLVARTMVVETIEISENTGEFVYCDDQDGIFLPEIVIFKDRNAAMRERTRILNMIKNWVDKQLGNNHDMFSVRKSSQKQQSRHINRRTRPDDNSTTAKE